MCILLLLNIDKHVWYIILLLALNIGMVKAVSNLLLSKYNDIPLSLFFSSETEHRNDSGRKPL